MGRLATMTDLAPYWIEVTRLENEADQVYRKLLSRLFSGTYEALTVLELSRSRTTWRRPRTPSSTSPTWSRRSP